MTTTLNEPQGNALPTRHAAEWGLASLLLGGLLVIMGMLEMQINQQMYGPHRLSANDAHPIVYAAILGALLLAGMTSASIAFAIRSLVLAIKHSQPSALGWAGLMISTFALLLWIGTFIDLFAILDMCGGFR